jgi:beta-lactamase superfamily II metal-dependent hydrolase
MPLLRATLIDVGWGDSILLETADDSGTLHFGLIDSNDHHQDRSSFIFLRKHFDKLGINPRNRRPVFDFVLLSHAHADHGLGLKAILRHFGTRDFWYPKAGQWGSLTELLRYANISAKRSSKNVGRHQAIDKTTQLPQFGPVCLEALWPEKDGINHQSENNNSVVLLLTLDEVSFVMTGDAEGPVWQNIRSAIPSNTVFFKVPHHGSANGAFIGQSPAWVDDVPTKALFGISSHVKPRPHPDKRVIDLLEQRSRTWFRTDEQYHLVFETSGKKLDITPKYFHQ